MISTICLGLNPKALKFLESNAKTVDKSVCRVYSDEGHLGTSGDGPRLYEYELRDGTIVREVIQKNVWKGGPRIFLCLKISHRLKCQWSKVDIENNI